MRGISESGWYGTVLAADLPEAVRRGELRAVYQPQFGFAARRWVAVELLCRWQHPEFGTIPPRTFIDLAERRGLIGQITRAMLRRACRTARVWLDRGLSIGVSVNVSPTELSSGFAGEVLERCRSAGIPRGILTIEITESPEYLDMAEVRRCVRSLRDGGVGVSMDDFGVGTSSMANLAGLPFSEVKIDRSLIQATSVEADAAVADAVALGKERGCRVVAEGIETPDQLARAIRLGCERGQGFLLASPMADDDVDRLLAVSQGPPIS